MYIIIYLDQMYQTKVLDHQDVLRCTEGEGNCTIISTKQNKMKLLYPDGHWRDLPSWDFIKEQVNKNWPMKNKDNKESPPV